MSQYFNEAKLNEDKSKRLIVACADAKRDEVERLIEADPNIEQTINDKNNQGETALHATATGGDHYIVQSLLDHGADPKLSDKQGRTPLMRAALMGNLDAVQVFVAHDEDNIFDAGSTGMLPIHCACLISHLALVEQFIELDEEGKTLTVRDNEGTTAFLAAATPPINTEVLEFLLESGSDVNEKNNAGETALLLAAKAGNNKAIQYLLSKGATFTAAANGMTPLHEVAFRKNKEGVNIFLDGVAGVDVEALNNDGESPLALACAGGDIECVKLLLQKGCNKDRGCVHQATKFERPDVIRLLAAKGADLNGMNRIGQTPLVIAVEEDLPDMVRLLLEGGADPMIKHENQEVSKKPITAGQLAKLRGRKDCQKLLEKAQKEGCTIS